MADDIQLNVGTGGATLKTVDDGTAHWQQVLMAFGAAARSTVEKTSPLPVDPVSISTATTSLATSASLAAGGQVDLDSAQIASGKTGKLIGLIISSAVPLKAVLKTVLNGVESADKAVFFTTPIDSKPIIMPSKEFYTQAESVTAGFDGFRVTVTNLDPTQASDVYCTHLYDEV